jgi:hypothetical protein
MVVLSIFSGISFLCQQYKLFFYWHLFFYFISNNNCRLLTINIVSFFIICYTKMATPTMQIGLTIEHKDEKYKIINHEKPYANFARHYTIQSMETGEIKTVYRHRCFVCLHSVVTWNSQICCVPHLR